jgi:hypothetical protein
MKNVIGQAYPIKTSSAFSSGVASLDEDSSIDEQMDSEIDIVCIFQSVWVLSCWRCFIAITLNGEGECDLSTT